MRQYAVIIAAISYHRKYGGTRKACDNTAITFRPTPSQSADKLASACDLSALIKMNLMVPYF